MAYSDLNDIAEHYEHCWLNKASAVQWKAGPMRELTPGFRVLVFPPNERRKMWTYATCGMSEQDDAPALEAHLFSPVQTEAHIELLTAVAHYHLTGAYLDVGHTVNFGRPWLPRSKCDHGLLSLPYMDGPKLEWFDGSGRKIRFLWLIPVTPEEVEFKRLHGLEALEARFEERGLDYLDPERRAVV
jgi:hypothetical protein